MLLTREASRERVFTRCRLSCGNAVLAVWQICGGSTAYLFVTGVCVCVCVSLFAVRIVVVGLYSAACCKGHPVML